MYEKKAAGRVYLTFVQFNNPRGNSSSFLIVTAIISGFNLMD